MYNTINFNNSTSRTSDAEFAASYSTSGQETRGRSLSWIPSEKLLFVESYTKYFKPLETARNDFEKGRVYTSIAFDYNEKALEQHLGACSSNEQKGKWKCMLNNFNFEFTGEASSSDIVYQKMEEILKKYPTHLLPYSYTFHSGVFTDNLNSSTTISSQEASFYSVPVAPQGSEPPSPRRRLETPPPPAIISSTPPPTTTT